ncbi:AAA family ATPase [Nannocystis pusilla]|uniref:AAA family ATPase n=1 Tax=Nannocystis pusilla TaxID=889268 RepID=UPI003B780D1D
MDPLPRGAPRHASGGAAPVGAGGGVGDRGEAAGQGRRGPLPERTGLRRDLERCLAAWHAHGRIEPFPLGEEDLSERPRVPQQLYGRERELAALRGAFEAMVETGAPGVVRVSGYSGVGKSTLVHKLQRPIVQAHGFFLSGKFDQYQRGIPTRRSRRPSAPWSATSSPSRRSA